jgi:hypothetical protein
VRAEVVRSAAVCLALAGCLSAPPSGGDESPARGDAGTGDGTPPVVLDDAGSPVTGCTDGSELDLAYVNRVSVGSGGASQISLADIAVFVNTGPDPFETAYIYAAVQSAPGVFAGVDLTPREGRLSLPAGEAHGALSVDSAAMVLSKVDESWTDLAYPALETSLMIDGLVEETDIVLELAIDRFRFEAPITLVPEGPFAGDPLDADRISARCGE